MSGAEMIERLRHWRQAGWLRALDLAFATFVQQLEPQAPASLLLAAALLAHAEGLGHGCLPLDALAHDALGMARQLGLDSAALPPGSEGPPSDAPGPIDTWALLSDDGAAAQAAWASAAVLQINPADDTGHTPLVLQGSRLYLRRYWRHERRIAAQVLARSQSLADVAGTLAATQGLPAEQGQPTAPVQPPQARALLDVLFPPRPGVDWQKVAAALALRARLTLITGGPGSGKTYTAARVLALLQGLHGQASTLPMRVALAAPTGKAAARLKQSIEEGLQALRGDARAATAMAPLVASVGPACTLHSLLGVRPGTRQLRHDAAHPLALDLLLVDEASMVDLAMMDSLLDALPQQARLVLLGDKDQLASVEAGSVMGELCGNAEAAGDAHAYDAATVQWLHQLTGQVLPAPAPLPADFASPSPLAGQTVLLRHSHRFGGAIGALAGAVNAGDGQTALALLRGMTIEANAHHERSSALALLHATHPAQAVALAVQGRTGHTGRTSASGSAGLSAMPSAMPVAGDVASQAASHADYLRLLSQRPSEPAVFESWARAVLSAFDGFRVLCALREGPWGVVGLNEHIEQALAQQHLLPLRRGPWYEGRPIMVTRNDAAQGVFNGDVGIVLRAASGNALRAYFLEGSALRSVAVARLGAVETAFATTVHKSQGSEFGHVLLVLPDEDGPLLTRELLYTGITRARQALTLVAAQPQRVLAACQRRTRRFSGLGQALSGAL